MANNLVRSLGGTRLEDSRPGVWGRDIGLNQVDKMTRLVAICHPLPLVAPSGPMMEELQ